MAVYHLKMNVGSRAGGQSALAKDEYIEREGRYERDREELEDKEHENMPEWAEDDPRSYWEAADEYERANGRLYREVQFALPKELNEAERRELASGFARRLTEGEQLPYTLAIHRGGPDGENPHAHLMFSERANDGVARSAEQWFKRYNAKEPEKGGARKSRAAVPRAWLEQTREAWEQEANGALRRAGPGGAYRSPQPGRAAGRGVSIRRPGAGGGVEPGAECSSRPAGVRNVTGRDGLVCPAEGRAGGEGESGPSAGAERRVRADRGEGEGDQRDRAGDSPGRGMDS